MISGLTAHIDGDKDDRSMGVDYCPPSYIVWLRCKQHCVRVQCISSGGVEGRRIVESSRSDDEFAELLMG